MYMEIWQMKKLKNLKSSLKNNKMSSEPRMIDKIEDAIGTIAAILLMIVFIMFGIVGFCAEVEPNPVQQQIKNEQMIGGW